MNKNIKVVEFRKIVVSDIFDQQYDDGVSWSRAYEYPLVINILKKYYKKGDLIHNSSWGFTGIHIKFKENLDKLFGTVLHSDILESNLDNTFIYDITKAPAKKEIEKYDIVINVSTLEEVNYNHLEIFNNLLLQLKPGGIFIATFDLNRTNNFFNRLTFKRRRVLQLKKFENYFSQKIETDGTPINGENSKLKNIKYKHLNCGLMVIKK